MSSPSARSGHKPLLTLVMILKDEEHTIRRTLASVRPFVDRWLVLDTGSTDRTREVVREALAGVPGELAEAPFVDFATTRNHALDLAGEESEFVLWLDADDLLEGGKELRAFLERERALAGADREAYYVKVHAGVMLDSARVLRTSARWRFQGVVHEVLCKEGRLPPSHRVPTTLVRHEVGALAAAKSRARWERDVKLLSAERERRPTDTRTAFYLGMTYFWLGRWEEAVRALDERARLGGWVEEVFQARLHEARAARNAEHPWGEVLERFLAAHALLPHRAEPLCDIATYYDRAGERALCLLFARRGYELPYPSADVLFVEAEVYQHRMADLVASSAYWLGAFELGEEAARKAAKAMPSDARLAKNLEFYLQRKRDVAKAKRR
jgi:glycosyltransferase involved in cell wall biosynthesis